MVWSKVWMHEAEQPGVKNCARGFPLRQIHARRQSWTQPRVDVSGDVSARADWFEWRRARRMYVIFSRHSPIVINSQRPIGGRILENWRGSLGRLTLNLALASRVTFQRMSSRKDGQVLWGMCLQQDRRRDNRIQFNPCIHEKCKPPLINMHGVTNIQTDLSMQLFPDRDLEAWRGGWNCGESRKATECDGRRMLRGFELNLRQNSS